MEAATAMVAAPAAAPAPAAGVLVVPGFEIHHELLEAMVFLLGFRLSFTCINTYISHTYF